MNFVKNYITSFNAVQLVDSYSQNIEKFRIKYYKNYIRNVYFIKYLPILFCAVLPFHWLIKVIFGVIWWLFSTMFFDHRDIRLFTPTIRIWFGVPGSGKTSMGAYLSKHSIAAKYNVVSNVEIKGTYRLDPSDLGRYDMSFGGDGCHCIYDEASIDFDNRNFKNFAQSDKPKYFALHRHMNNRVDVFSQGYDIDKRIRDRVGSNGLFHLQRVKIKGFVMYRKIKKVLFIRKDDKQMIDGFEFYGLPRICFTMPVWSSFDTTDLSLCPTEQKEWEKW